MQNELRMAIAIQGLNEVMSVEIMSDPSHDLCPYGPLCQSLKARTPKF